MFYFSGYDVLKFDRKDRIVDFMSLMANNMIPTLKAICGIDTNFLSDLCKYIENNRIEEATLLNNTANSLDPFDFHVLRCGEKFCNEIEHNLIHTYYSDADEDEDEDEDIRRNQRDLEQWGAPQEELFKPYCCNGNVEIVKIFNQFYVICVETPSFFAFCLRGHQSVCEKGYQSRGGVDLLNFVLCKT